MNLEITSLSESAYKSDLYIIKKGNNFFVTLDDAEIDITELIKENAPHLLSISQDKMEECEMYVDLSLEAEFEVTEESDNYGQIPGEPHVPYEVRTSYEITDTSLYSCELELSLSSAREFKVNFLRTLNKVENKNFYRTLINIIEEIQYDKV